MRRRFHRSLETSFPSPRSVLRPAVIRLEDRTLLSLLNWTGSAGDNNWNTPANWSSDAVPTAADDVVISSSFSDITILHSASSSDSVNSINSQAAIDITGGSLSIAGVSTSDDPSGASTINNALTLTSTLTISGDMAVNGPFTWENGSTLSGSGTIDAYGGMTIDTAGISYLSGVTLNNHGTATWTGSSGIYASNGATINNLAGATFNAQADDSLTWDPAYAGGPAPPVFNNAGSFIRSGDTNETDINIPFNNTGSVSVQAGFLHLGESDYPILSTSTGSFTGAAGTTLYLTSEDLTASSSIAGDTVWLGGVNDAGSYDAGTATVAFSTTFTGAIIGLGNSLDVGGLGSFQAGGTVGFSPSSGGPVTLTTGTLTVHSGTLTGIDSFVATGMFTWENGSTLSGSGTIDAYGGMTIDTAGISYLSGVTLNNHGTATWTGSSGIYASNGATINNLAGATFNAQADDSSDLGPGVRRWPGSSGLQQRRLVHPLRRYERDGHQHPLQQHRLGQRAGGLPASRRVGLPDLEHQHRLVHWGRRDNPLPDLRRPDGFLQHRRRYGMAGGRERCRQL